MMSHEGCAGDGTPPDLPSPSAEGSRVSDRVHGNVPHEEPPPDTPDFDVGALKHASRGRPVGPVRWPVPRRCAIRGAPGQGAIGVAVRIGGT
jgi:hypothetical protein